MKAGPVLAGLVVLLGLVACAEQPMVMSYYPDDEINTGEDKVWPSLPQVPRYRYAGLLVGDVNFNPDETYEKGTGEKIFNWIVGLTSKKANPLQLNRPQSGMVDRDGRIYVTDVGNEAVFVFDEVNGSLHVWRDADRNDHLISPIGIVTRSENEILVADSELGRIVRLDRNGNPIGSISDDSLSRPTGMDIDDASGELYVADTGEHNIKVFDQNNVLIRTVGRHGDGPGQFNAPTYICISNGLLYVSDTLNARVQVLTRAGDHLQTIGQRGLFIGNFSRPKGITSDSDGNIYVVESYYDHVLIFDSAGQFLLPIGGTGVEAGNFFLPAGVWSDSQDRIYTADMLNGRIFIMQYLGGE